MPGVDVISWVYGIDSSDTYVATWLEGSEPTDYTQWKGRTNMTTPKGDLTINDLELEDDGQYVCKHDINASPPGRLVGARYMLEVTGKL